MLKGGSPLRKCAGRKASAGLFFATSKHETAIGTEMHRAISSVGVPLGLSGTLAAQKTRFRSTHGDEFGFLTRIRKISSDDA